MRNACAIIFKNHIKRSSKTRREAAAIIGVVNSSEDTNHNNAFEFGIICGFGNPKLCTVTETGRGAFRDILKKSAGFLKTSIP